MGDTVYVKRNKKQKLWLLSNGSREYRWKHVEAECYQYGDDKQSILRMKVIFYSLVYNWNLLKFLSCKRKVKWLKNVQN